MFPTKENRNTDTNSLNRVKTFFQPKLSVNQPGDSFEQEADTMADRVMRMGIPSNDHASFFKPAANTAQRKCQHCEEEEKLHRKESSDGKVEESSDLDNYVGSLNTSGQPLSAGIRGFFEPRFGHDFSNVRVHTDSVAAKSAQSINALAYTTGNNIVFNSGQFSPESDSGKRLMAHELTHVVQQGSSVRNKIQRDEISGQPEQGATDAAPIHIDISDPLAAALQGIRFRILAPVAGQAPAVSPAAPSSATGAASTGQAPQTGFAATFPIGTIDNFNIDDSTLNARQEPAFQRILTQVRSLLTTCPASIIRITGYADAPGTDAHNLDLGTRRADFVRSRLELGMADRASLLGPLIFTSSRGEADPVDRSAGTGYSSRNRRVEVEADMSCPPLTLSPSHTPEPPHEATTTPEHTTDERSDPDTISSVPEATPDAEEHRALSADFAAGTVPFPASPPAPWNFSLSLVYRHLNAHTFGGPHDQWALDIFHEPNLGITVSGNPNDYVLQAAISALNLHLRLHGEDLLEASIAEAGGYSFQTGQWGLATQAQLELHLTTDVSVTGSIALDNLTGNFSQFQGGLLIHFGDFFDLP